jgi:hypothetical protein
VWQLTCIPLAGQSDWDLRHARNLSSTTLVKPSEVLSVSQRDSETVLSLAIALSLIGSIKDINLLSCFQSASDFTPVSLFPLDGFELESLAHLRSLAIDSEVLMEGDATAIAHMSALTSLRTSSKFMHSRADGQCMHKLAPIVSQLTQLKELELPNRLQLDREQEVVCLAVVLQACSLLNKLRLSVDQRESMSLQPIAYALDQLASLKSLHVTVYNGCVIMLLGDLPGSPHSYTIITEASTQGVE